MAGEELRATLRGGGAHLGSVRASDVARLITGLEATMAAAAYVALGKPRKGGTGRHRIAIEAASHLRFHAVEEGSVVAVLGLPDLAETGGPGLELQVDDLAGAAFDRIMASFGQSDEQVDRSLARTLAELAENLGIGDRHDELTLASSRTAMTAHLDAGARGRMRRLADTPAEHQPDVLVGSLYEADFDKQTAHLHTPTGESVVVAFTVDLADAIYGALRSQAAFEGEVSYDPVTAIARRVDVRRISKPDPLPFDAESFWQPVSIEELARSQGVVPALLDRTMIALSAEEMADIAGALADLDA